MAKKMKSAKPAASKGKRIPLIDSATFATSKYRQRWLIENIIVARQPGVIGGPPKSLKMCIALDMAISLASGTPFLGQFSVPHRRRVAVFSGESGAAVLQETARRICAAKDVHLAELDISWGFTLPKLSSEDALTAFGELLRETQPQVVILDPLYVCLLAAGQGAAAGNLFAVGPILLAMAETCLSAGATPIVVHHTTRGSTRKKGDPSDYDQAAVLGDLAFAGITEFVRQWLLLNRRIPYMPGSGQHELLMTVGGSAGHGDLWRVHVDEGVLVEDMTGRRWDVDVAPAEESATEEPQSKSPGGKSSPSEPARPQWGAGA